MCFQLPSDSTCITLTVHFRASGSILGIQRSKYKMLPAINKNMQSIRALQQPHQRQKVKVPLYCPDDPREGAWSSIPAPAASKGQAICGEKTNLKTLHAVLWPPVPQVAIVCCWQKCPWLIAKMRALIWAIEQIRFWDSQEDPEGFVDESHGVELHSEANGTMLSSDVTCLV